MRETLAAVGKWTRPLARPIDPVPATGDWRGRAASAVALSELERFRLLTEAGVPMVACEPAGSGAAAVKAAERVGYPVAMKASGPEIAHKTELGLVRLGLANATAVKRAFSELQALSPRGSGAEIVIQPMAGPGVEMILGARAVPGFGSLIVVGMGGTYVELLGISSHGLAPIGRESAIDMLDETPLGAILAGARGKGPYDIEAAADAIQAFSRFADAAGDKVRAATIGAELRGYEGAGVEIPERRRVGGFASPFPVRAIGLLEPEEIFLANREKFSQVTLTIGQPVAELETTLAQIQEGGVLALRVPASEITGEAAATDPNTEVYIYILPREIERVVEGARTMVLDALVARLVEASIGPVEPVELGPDDIQEPSLSDEVDAVS